MSDRPRLRLIAATEPQTEKPPAEKPEPIVRRRILCDLAGLRVRRREPAPDCTWVRDCGGASCITCSHHIERGGDLSPSARAILDALDESRGDDPCYVHKERLYGPFDDLEDLRRDLLARGLTESAVDVGKYSIARAAFLR